MIDVTVSMNMDGSPLTKLTLIQDLSRFCVRPDERGRSLIVIQLWEIVQNTLFAWSPTILYGWRRFLLRLFGAEIGKRVLIRPTAKIKYPWKLKIGDYSWIGDNTSLYSLGPIFIGANAVISQKSYLCTGTHDHTDPRFPYILKAINVGDEAWVCADVFIGPGVSIGAGVVVGARSTVWRDIEAMCIAAGSPAVVKGPRIKVRKDVQAPEHISHGDL